MFKGFHDVMCVQNLVNICIYIVGLKLSCLIDVLLWQIFMHKKDIFTKSPTKFSKNETCQVILLLIVNWLVVFENIYESNWIISLT